eukprot:5527506-Prorocentrum_lima.AAC.1
MKYTYVRTASVTSTRITRDVGLGPERRACRGNAMVAREMRLQKDLWRPSSGFVCAAEEQGHHE